MKIFDELKKENYVKQYEKLRKENNQFNKKLYDSDIIQKMYDRINELEDRIERLERR